jgi:hypothetical protein
VRASAKGKVTRREQFLAEMDAVIPWARLLALIEPHYPQAGHGRQPLGLEKMLRIYFLQQWFNLSDPQAEDAIYDSESMRRFARVEWFELSVRIAMPKQPNSPGRSLAFHPCTFITAAENRITERQRGRGFN